MRFLILAAGMLVIIGGYYMGLCAMTNQAVGQLSAIQQQYENAGAMADFSR
jgi:hypothetical protein